MCNRPVTLGGGNMTATRADALVVEEELRSAKLTPRSDGGYQIAVVLRARVLDRSGASDRGFRAEVDLGRERFLDGEAVTLSVRSSRPARIYVLGITEDGAALLLPNAHVRDTRVEPGQWLRFPDEELEASGVRLTARVPSGQRSASEALLVLAVRGDERLEGLVPVGGETFRAAEARQAGELLVEFLSPLLELPADAWTFDQVVYEVVAR